MEKLNKDDNTINITKIIDKSNEIDKIIKIDQNEDEDFLNRACGGLSEDIKPDKDINNKNNANIISNKENNINKKQRSTKDICFKCKINKPYYYIKLEYICKDCLIYVNNHIFRRNLRAHCKIRHEDNLLIAISGGLNSMVMLHLFNLSFNESTSKKKLFFKFKFLFIDDSFFYTDYILNKDKDKLIKQRKDNFNTITKIAEKYQFEINIINLEECINIHNSNDTNLAFNLLTTYNNLISDTINFNNVDKLLNIIYCFKDVSFRNKYCDIIRHNLIAYYAMFNNFNKVVFGNSMSNLVNDVFNLIISGRGNNLNTHYIDNSIFGDKLCILRPMKDFINKEILIMSKIFKIDIIPSSSGNLNYTNNLLNNKSINNKLKSKPFSGDCELLVETFIDKLQDKMFSTTPTILSTAEKLIINKNNNINNYECVCKLCYGVKDKLYNDLEIGSYDIIKNFSLAYNNDNNNNNINNNIEKDKSFNIFKVEKDLCFGCRRMLSDYSKEDIISDYSVENYNNLILNFNLFKIPYAK